MASADKKSPRGPRGPRDEPGVMVERITAAARAQPTIRETLSSILMTAAHEPRTREKLKAFLTTSLVPPVADRIEGEERLLRASLA